MPPTPAFTPFSSYDYWGYDADSHANEDYQMMLPYNSTLGDVPSDQKWNKGWRCEGKKDNKNSHIYPLPLWKGSMKKALEDDTKPWETNKSTITTQEACYTECQSLFSL